MTFANETTRRCENSTFASNEFVCLKQTPVDRNIAYYVGTYVFPVIFSVGLTGNILNLLVLNSRGMKSKANYLLSAMAVADICFFLCMFAINLHVYDPLARSEAFVKFYYKSKMTFTTLVNWFSSASVWFAVMVTVERLIAIRTPLRARYLWRSWRIVFVMGSVFGCTLLLQLYNFAWLRPRAVRSCDDTNKTVYLLQQIRVTDGYYLFKFVKISQVAGPLVTVTIPLIMLVALNSLLTYYLKRSVREAANLYTSCSKRSEKENKVTLTVLVIVIAFFVFNLPSAVVYLCVIFHPNPKSLAVYSLFANYLVTLNKAMNFWLYCLASESFRKRVAASCGKLIAGKCHKEPRSTFSSQSSVSFSVNSTKLYGVRTYIPVEENNNNYRLAREKVNLLDGHETPFAVRN